MSAELELSDEQAALLRQGVELFNAGEFFEAHEAWEDLWHELGGPRKRFVQGLIQCAVTLEHVRRGNPRGVRNVWENAQAKFAGLPPRFMGIAAAELLEGVRRTIQPVLDLPEDRFAPGLSRGQDLPVDLDQRPRIELA